MATDLLLGTNNDLVFRQGSLVLIDRIEDLVRQRLLFKLRTFTDTLFTNINFGINQNLLFNKGTQGLLDQDIRSNIEATEGVIKITSFSSNVNKDRLYTCSFEVQIETGEILGINNLVFGRTGLLVDEGVWVDGNWDYRGLFDFEEIWGS